MTKEINLLEQEIEKLESVNYIEIPLPGIEPNGNTKEYIQASLPGILEKIKQNEEQQKKHKETCVFVKRVIEALLFATSEPLEFEKIREVTDTIALLKPRILREILHDLQQEYITQQRGFRLDETAQGFVLRSCEEFSPYIDILYRNKRGEKLSHAAAEVLAIIAYRQPITKPQIEALRGVDSSGVLSSLLERQLIESMGRLEAPGRPTLYGITKNFLSHFGLRNLNELPQLRKN
jgi:segregation and condensation protein B